MKSKVYVGNLPDSATETALANVVSEYGAVKRVTLIADRATGRNLGYAFVEMATSADAQRAVEKLDGTSYDGWELTVRAANPTP